ncbi:MAG: C10 family peptidase [Bacteroidales bacterium]|nr:C10 family peptidase [Bacteroidales bacterium]
MKKTTIFFSLLALGSMAMQAAVLTPEQALERAMGPSAATVRALSQAKQQPQLLFTASCDEQAAAYVFGNGDNGYVVLSADDAALPVLGFSDSGTFDPAQMPDAMRYWLDMYATEIAYARANGYAAASASRANDWAAISPLCSTLWDQGEPYNDLCPSSNGVHAYTGCVATAMAQMMKYHQYPSVGTGTLTNTSLSQTTIVNLADYPFQWDQMLNSYGRNATEAQKNAVAELMLCCGMSVDMNYGLDSSGTTTNVMPTALINNFNYDKNCHLMTRDYYTATEWETAVYNEIKNVGPVVYAGVTANSEGHCFIADGYKDGYFHFNWGWGGVSDGYYLLTALDPINQGFGGATQASDGFNYSQRIVINAKAPVEGSDYYYEMYAPYGFSISKVQLGFGMPLTLSGGFYNGSTVPVSGTLGIWAVDSNGNKQYIQGRTIEDLPLNSGFSSYDVMLPWDMADGTYTISPAWCSKDLVYNDILMPITGITSYTMVVKDKLATFTANTKSPAITITNVAQVTNPWYSNMSGEISMTLNNNSDGEYLNEIMGVLYLGEDEAESGLEPYIEGAETMVDVPAGTSIDFVYKTSFSGMSAGDYIFVMVDPSDYEWLSDPITITLSTSQVVLYSVSDFTMYGATETASGLTVSDTSNLEFEFTLSCTQGMFDGVLYVGIVQGEDTYFRAYFPSDYIVLSAGESQVMTATGELSAVNGKTYHAYVYSGPNISSTKLAGPITFTYVESSDNGGGAAGIAGVEADGEAVAVEYYNLQGAKIVAPAQGQACIRVARYADGTTRAEKIVK